MLLVWFNGSYQSGQTWSVANGTGTTWTQRGVQAGLGNVIYSRTVTSADTATMTITLGTPTTSGDIGIFEYAAVYTGAGSDGIDSVSSTLANPGSSVSGSVTLNSYPGSAVMAIAATTRTFTSPMLQMTSYTGSPPWTTATSPTTTNSANWAVWYGSSGSVIASPAASSGTIGLTWTGGSNYVCLWTISLQGSAAANVGNASGILAVANGGTGQTTASAARLALNPVSTVTVTSNAGTVPSPAGVANFTNSSAAAMTITMATTGAVDGQVITVRVYDYSAASQTIGWTNTENSSVSAPTTSNGSTTSPKTVTFMFNGATSKWRCINAV